MVDDNGNISGFYYDLLNYLNKNNNFKYEFVVCTIYDGLEKLEDGDIDIMPGLPIGVENFENIRFNRHSISKEKFGIYSKKNMDIYDLTDYDALKVGIVRGDYNSNWVLDFFKSNNTNIEFIRQDDYEQLENLLENNEIDLMIDSAYKQTKYNKVYEFTANQVYLAGNKNSQDILVKFDSLINNLTFKEKLELSKIYGDYFNESYLGISFKQFTLYLVVLLLSLILFLSFIIPKIKKDIIKKKIRNRMRNNQYLLQYQPIYNPRNKEIIGFEGLLRLEKIINNNISLRSEDENKKIISPAEFIPEIEKNGMLFEISLWILEKAILDYQKIKSFEIINKKDFYISINLSLNELQNDDFVKKAIDILSKSNLGKNKICLEIVERFKSDDTDKIKENIKHLKNAGFKIAIDDFGVEYSNLDILEILDVDTIKVDKNFVDGIGKDIIKNEIILFISNVSKIKNISVVLEGIEEEYQDAIIKNINNNSLYVQGYYYSKPIYMENIANL